MNEPVILRADARFLPLADASVDLIVTSPPYFGMRSYTDGGEHYDGQVGAEATPVEFVDSLMACTREMIRVLKPTGSIWVNLGDKYSQRVATRHSSHQDGLFPDLPELRKDWKRDRAAGLARMPAENVIDATSGRHVPEKSLMGLPWRFALRCIDELGLILRAEVVWSKPNGLPESVKDRVRRSHEQWFHFTLQPRYYSAVDEIRQAHKRNWLPGKTGGHTYEAMKAAGEKDSNLANSSPNPLGSLPGSVWTIATQPLKVPAELGVDHFAAFPMEWPRRLILGWSPREVCTACGKGRRPLVTIEKIHGTPRQVGSAAGRGSADDNQRGMNAPGDTRPSSIARITGYVCACPDSTASTTPGVVLDPFGGTGTTALVAAMHGRIGISVDASADYCRLAGWRAADPKERGRAADRAADVVARIPRRVEGQGSLFDMETL